MNMATVNLPRDFWLDLSTHQDSYIETKMKLNVPWGSKWLVRAFYSNIKKKKQRLTHPRFLDIYSGILKKGGKIIQKTDDCDFFAFSLESYAAAGFKVLETCEDYNGSEGDVETEHEKKFKEQGKRIYRAVAEVWFVIFMDCFGYIRGYSARYRLYFAE